MEFLIIFLLIVLNGVFSMSEIAIVSARKSKLKTAVKRGSVNARIALETANSPNRFMSTVQIGITLIGILTGIFSGESITENLKLRLESVEVIADYAHAISVMIVIIVITFFSLVIGELVPKRIGLSNAESIAVLVARPMKLLTKITAPFVWLLTITSDIIMKILGIKAGKDSAITEEEIKSMIRESTEGGDVQEIEQDIVERVFSLGDRNVSSLMTHRNDLIMLSVNHNSVQVKEIVQKEIHSIYPVLDARKDIIGIVLLKDLFKHINEEGFNLASLIRQAQFIPKNLTAYEALQSFKTSKTHQAIVMDEFGEMQGLLTMNDLLEALVGDVSEFYSTEFSFDKRADGSWLVDGQFPFPDFMHKFDLEELINDYKFNTVSGLILHQLKRIPKPGDTITFLDFKIEVMDMDGARIDKILIVHNKH